MTGEGEGDGEGEGKGRGGHENSVRTHAYAKGHNYRMRGVRHVRQARMGIGL